MFSGKFRLEPKVFGKLLYKAYSTITHWNKNPNWSLELFNNRTSLQIFDCNIILTQLEAIVAHLEGTQVFRHKSMERKITNISKTVHFSKIII